MKKRIIPLLFVMLIVLSGCGNIDDSVQDDIYDELSEYYGVDEQEETSTPLTSFTLPYLQGQTLDPITCPDGAQQTLGSLLYEGLFALDTQFAVQNVLAESYSYDAASFTYTITLHDGITFTDGNELTAQDVVTCLQRACSSQRYSARLTDIASIKRGGSHTVIIKLKAANSNFIARLDIPIVESGTESQLVPIGTGPYSYQTADGGIAYLSRNTGWWQNKSLPLNRIELLTVKDNDTMAYAFYAREVNLLSCDLTATVDSNVSGSGSYTDADTAVMLYIGVNTTHQVLSTPAVRQALSLGIDRVSCVNAFLMGHGVAAQFPLSPASALYPSSAEVSYSPDHFAQAAKTAGITSGSTKNLTLLVNEESDCKVSMAQKIAADLSAYDLNITVKSLPWDSYLAALKKGNFDLYLGEYKLTADWDLSSLLLPGGALNYGGFNNADTTALLQQYLTASDDTTRQIAMQALCENLQQQSPILPICFKRTSVLLTVGAVDTITPTAADPFYGFSNWTMHISK